MSQRNFLLRFFGISAFCLAGIAARETIVGGFKVERDRFRYQATIYIAGHEPRCGGGIIGEKFIVTAAHCVIAHNGGLIGKPVYVLVGTHDLNITGVVVQVEKIFYPKEYNPRIYCSPGDIAVLKLKEPLELNKYTVLYIAPYRENTFYDRKTAQIAGCGWNRMFEMSYLIGEHTDHQLRYSDAIIRSETECKHDHPTANLTGKHLCARSIQYIQRPTAVCIGDGGGPLVIKGKTVIGILSVITDACSESNSSGIYTRVSLYRAFIYAAIEEAENPNMRILYV